MATTEGSGGLALSAAVIPAASSSDRLQPTPVFTRAGLKKYHHAAARSSAQAQLVESARACYDWSMGLNRGRSGCLQRPLIWAATEYDPIIKSLALVLAAIIFEQFGHGGIVVLIEPGCGDGWRSPHHGDNR